MSAKSWMGVLEQATGSLLFTLDLGHLQRISFPGAAVMCRMELKDRTLGTVAVVQVRENGHLAEALREGRYEAGGQPALSHLFLFLLAL